MNINNLLKELQEALENDFKDNFTGLVLFGSYAKAAQKPNSDIDLILTFKKLPENRLDRLRLIEDVIDSIEDKYKIAINPIVSNEEKLQKTYLLIDIADYAKIIVDKNKKITTLFNSIKKDYKKGLAQKKKVGDHYILWISDEISA